MQRVSESDRSRVALFGRSRTPRWRERPPVASRHPTQPDARTHARTHARYPSPCTPGTARSEHIIIAVSTGGGTGFQASALLPSAGSCWLAAPSTSINGQSNPGQLEDLSRFRSTGSPPPPPTPPPPPSQAGKEVGPTFLAAGFVLAGAAFFAVLFLAAACAESASGPCVSKCLHQGGPAGEKTQCL